MNQESILYFTLAFILLGVILISAEVIMRGAVIVAERFGLSQLVIATTLISFGTILPTVAVNVAMLSIVDDPSDIILGNAVGTTLVNIGLGLGIPAAMVALHPKYQVFEKEIPIYLAFTAILTAFALDGAITSFEGILLVIAYLITLTIVYQYARKERVEEKYEEEVDLDTSTISTTETKNQSVGITVALLIVGTVFLLLSSIALAIITPKLASSSGIPDYILGLTIIGVGTSLPTILTSIRSVRKGYYDIVIGNVFGGNIVNIGLGLGLIAMMYPLTVSEGITDDIYFNNIINIAVIFGLLVEFKLVGKNKSWDKVSGIVMISMYLGYMLWKLL